MKNTQDDMLALVKDAESNDSDGNAFRIRMEKWMELLEDKDANKSTEIARAYPDGRVVVFMHEPEHVERVVRTALLIQDDYNNLARANGKLIETLSLIMLMTSPESPSQQPFEETVKLVHAHAKNLLGQPIRSK